MVERQPRRIRVESGRRHIPSREEVTNDLGREIASGRTTQFNRALHDALTSPVFADSALADIWQVVEDGFASQNRVTPRPNPYRKDPR